jgi:hypothetical protein
MKTMILAAVIALGVGVAGSAFAEGEGGSATGCRPVAPGRQQHCAGD